jgi:hypothetical protein
MAEYLLLIVGDDDAYGQLSEEESKAMYAGHYAFMDELRNAGVTIVSSAELDHPSTARTILDDGTVTDGPFAEAKEQVGGYYLIDVPSIEEAVAWAKKIPLLPGDKLEVRKAK